MRAALCSIRYSIFALLVRDKHIVGVGDPGSPRFSGQPKLRARYLIVSRIKRGKLGNPSTNLVSTDKFPRTEIIASRYSVISIHRGRKRREGEGEVGDKLLARHGETN